MTRIWYQSFTDAALHGAYLQRLLGHLSELAGEGTGVHVADMTPAAVPLHRVTELRCAARCVDNAVRAQDEGHDVFVVGHFQDTGIDEARCAVDIPVVGMGEASMLHALTLGRTFGLVAYDEVFADWHRSQAARLSLQDRLAGVASIATSPADVVDVLASAAGYDSVRDEFVRVARSLVAAGAEVIIPAGGLFALLSAHERDFRVDDAVVLNPIAVVLRAAETAAWLRRRDGTTTSRRGAFARAPEQALRELRDVVTTPILTETTQTQETRA